MKKLSISGLAFILLAPALAFAQESSGVVSGTTAVATPSGGALQGIVNIIVAVRNIVNLLIPILIGVAIVIFFWGLVKYIQASGKGAADGKNIMIAGLVSLFVMVSLWGILNFAAGSLGIQGFNNGGALNPPHVGS